MANIKLHVRDLIQKNLSFDSIDEFSALNQTSDVVSSQLNSCYEELLQFFNNGFNEPIESEAQLRKEAVQELVNQLFQQEHTKKLLMILRIINRLVHNRVIEVRLVCEFMLNNLVYSSTNGKQKPTNTFIWVKVLETTRKFIIQHDYKSCRDIFKMLLDVIKRLPHSESSFPPPLETELPLVKSPKKRKASDTDDFNGSTITDDIKLESLYDTVSFLLDPENYFMPRYLAINEIKTVLTFGRESYHQRFHQLLTKFIEEFIPTAHLISVSGRDRLLPVVGFSNLHSLHSFWRFNPSSCKFNTGGPLPYFKHVSKPHDEVYFYLLRQSTPQYLLLNLMSLHRNVKSRFQVFEEQFAISIVDAMYLTEKNPNSNFENLRIWNNLVNHLVNANQIINLPALMQQLSQILKKKGDSFKQSRDWLMWFLLLIITSYMNRNHLSEFSDLYELLYKDEEVLPAPDINSFSSVIRFAPLSNWINLNIKLNINAQKHHLENITPANYSSVILPIVKSFVIPEILRKHFNLFQECLINQNSNDFGLSVCLNAFSTDSNFFNQLLYNMLDRIGKNAGQIQGQQHQMANSPSNSASPGSQGGNTIFTGHQPLSMELIASFTLHVRMHVINCLSVILTHKNQHVKNLNISASLVETFARLIIFDPDNFVKNFTQHVWQVITTTGQNLNTQTPNNQLSVAFVNQQLNLLIELICFRLKNLTFTHRTTFLLLLNNLFSSSTAAVGSSGGSAGQQQPGGPKEPASGQQQQQAGGQRGGTATSGTDFMKHHIIYVNTHCAILKILSSFSGSDFYELLNSIISSPPNKHGPKYFSNTESEEINKAIVILMARAVHLTCNPQDSNPFDNKDKEENFRGLMREIMQKTPLFFPSYALEYFPKIIQEFFQKEPQPGRTDSIYADSSNKQYKMALKKKVDEDYRKFLDFRHETQVQAMFQNNALSAHTLICIFFNLLQDETGQQNFSTYLSFILSYLNNCENKKISQSIRTFCDYLISESGNKSPEVIKLYVENIIKMITVYNIFTYDRFLMIMVFRSFDPTDMQLVFQILNLLLVHNRDFQTKLNDFITLWNSNCNGDNDEWNPAFYAQYIRAHPERFFHEGIREQLNMTTGGNSISPDAQINTYYGSVVLRCVPVLDFLNNRYVELSIHSPDAESLLDNLNVLFRFHNSPLSYIYNSFVYYDLKFRTASQAGELAFNRSKKKRLFQILASNQSTQFTAIFQKYLDKMDTGLVGPDISTVINIDYYYALIQRLVIRMLDKDPTMEFNKNKSEFPNPSCHLLYLTLCELMSLELFSDDPDTFIKSFCPNLIEMFFVGFIQRFQNKNYAIDDKEFVYWTNAAGILFANLPEPYWRSIYEILVDTMKTDETLNSTEPPPGHNPNHLFDLFDLYLANVKNCFNRVTLITTIIHSLWCHSNANHFSYFVQMLKDRKEEFIRTESQFLFICKIIGPFLSKIHMENTTLFLELAQQLYDMLSIVDRSSQELYHLDTICNFFYHLKYRHIGESIKEKIHTLIPSFRPELKAKLKYITSELNQQMQLQQHLQSSHSNHYFNK